MSTYSKKPSLDDARARIGRAKEHIATLEREIVAAMPPDRTITTVIAGGFLSGTRYINPPPILPILIGETIYNLRAALDYLVYELFYLDTGETTNITKFVIEDSEQSWDRRIPTPDTPKDKIRKMWIHRLTAAHQAALKRLQPCYGCKWTGVLRELSNPDKHRRLLTVIGSVNHDGFGAMSGPVMVTFNLTTKVAFDDSSLVVETLKLLQQEVADVINAFNADFQ